MLKSENSNYFQNSNHKINFALICHPQFRRILPNYLLVFTKTVARRNVARMNYFNSQISSEQQEDRKILHFHS